ncbi:MAG: GAF domain-containing protein [Firmicutes bacterium]|nr:GAF domain-containing protein [Bacillota bacterium]
MPWVSEDLSRRTNDLQHELEQYRTEEEILYLTAQAVGETTDPQKLLDFLVERLGRRLGATYGHILLLDENKERLHIRATWGVPLRSCAHIKISIGEGITGWVAMTGQPALVADVSEDPRYVESQSDTASEVAVPLRVRGEIIGVLNLEKNTKNGFSDHDCRMLAVAASLAASAIQTARLLQERERRIQTLSLLYEISSGVGGVNNLRETALKVVHAIRGSMKWPLVAVFALDPIEKRVRWLADTMGGDPARDLPGPLVDFGLAEWCAVHGVADIVVDSAVDPRSRGAAGTKSTIVAPLLAGRQVVGCLMAQDFKRGHFGFEDLDMLSAIARDLGVILENARLNEELKRRVRDLSVLYEVASALSSTLEMDRVLNATFDMVGSLLGVERCSLMLVEASTGELVMKAARGADPSMIDRVRFRLGEGLAGWAAREAREVIVPDVSKEPRFIESVFEGPRIVSMACVPLISEGRVIGVLTVASSTPREFSADDTKMLYIIGSRAAVAIENARLHEATRQLATTDCVTSCYNHRHLQELLSVEVQRSLQLGGEVSLIMIDLDRFKDFNDAFGHPAGDELLKMVAQVTSSCLGPGDIVARYGGDEFAIIVPGAGIGKSLGTAESIREAIEGEAFPAGDGRPAAKITASLGLASCPFNATTRAGLVEAADAALYAAKRRGGNSIVVSQARPYVRFEEGTQ